MLRRYKKVIVASELEVQEAIYGGVAPDRIVSTSPHVDSVDRDEIPSGEFRRRVGIASHQVVVLFLGRLVPIKNLELMIEVLRRLPEPYVFVAVGPEEDPGYVTRLRMLAGECGVEDRFRIVGAAYGRSKWEAMADCNVLVLCSHSENLGVAALEAISFGLPVVVGDTCGVSERVKPGQGVVVPLDAEAFRNLLKNALQTQIARFQPTRSSIESIGCG